MSGPVTTSSSSTFIASSAGAACVARYHGWSGVATGVVGVTGVGDGSE